MQNANFGKKAQSFFNLQLDICILQFILSDFPKGYGATKTI